jgi:hypothetical protein
MLECLPLTLNQGIVPSIQAKFTEARLLSLFIQEIHIHSAPQRICWPHQNGLQLSHMKLLTKQSHPSLKIDSP